MRWRFYNGSRIPSPGVRTSIEEPATIRFGQTTRRYGCVWQAGGAFKAYTECRHPGEIEDFDLGTFDSERAARRAVVEALTRTQRDVGGTYGPSTRVQKEGHLRYRRT